MLTVIELLIGVVVIVGVARYIIKGYSATGVLFVGGLVLLIISALMGHKVLPASETSTGYTATDIVEYIKILLMSRGGDLGMMIMMLCGFAAYMTHIGANDMVVKLASKPLQYINSPYLLMIAAYFVACLMSLAVSSATGLGVLLMATLFPVMVNVGISRGGRFRPGAEHHWLYPKPDLDCHFFWFRQHYSDAGISDFNHAGRDDHRFRQCAFLRLC